MSVPMTAPLAPRLSPLTANLICMASMLAWSIGLPAAQSLIPVVPPLPLTAARMSLAGLALIPLWLLIEGRGGLAGADWGRGILIGGGTIGLGALLLVLGQARTNEVTVAVISATLPIAGIALEVLLDGRKLSLALILGVMLSLIGGVIALGAGGSGLNLGVGAGLCLVSVVLFALGSRMTVKAFPTLTPLGSTTVTVAGAGIATAVAALAHMALGGAQPDWAALGWADLGALAIFAVVGMAISQILWILSVGKLGIGLAALHINATPFYVMLILFAMGAAWNWPQVWGAAIVGTGVLIAQGIIALPQSRGGRG